MDARIFTEREIAGLNAALLAGTRCAAHKLGSRLNMTSSEIEEIIDSYVVREKLGFYRRYNAEVNNE